MARRHLNAFSIQKLYRLGFLSDLNAVNIASLDRGFSEVFVSRQLLLAEVDPQIAEYCMNAQDFSGCIETMQGSSEPSFPGSEDSYSDGESSESEYSEEDEFVEGEFEDYVDDEFAEGEFEEYVGDEFAEDELEDYVDDEFDDGSDMYPEDMGAPTAQACTGDTFGEQLACAIVSALSTLLQQAFTSN